jgi:DNA (cytosine-5)-methyltransferase 1
MEFGFVDLFAGIGGFHAALAAFGGNGVAAVEIDEGAASVYESNWKLRALGDVTKVVSESHCDIPNHDVLAAGFPCQPFSKSGGQRGMEETRGTLYWNILQIIRHRKPAFVLLENVRNLAGPRHAHEWQIIVETLRDEGYRVSDVPAIFSPHLLPPELGGRPQVRERIFICAVRDPESCKGDLAMDAPVVDAQPVNGWDPMTWNLESDLPLDDACDDPSTLLSVAETLWIDAWNEFVEGMWELRDGRRLPGFPLWGDHWVRVEELKIPTGTPKWKSDFLRKNADFYTQHQALIDTWAVKWGFYTDAFPPSRRKFEWQAQDTPRLWDTVMQMRPTGIRAKRATYLPALVAITQTSIIGPRRRKLSVREAARLQGLPESFSFGMQKASDSFKQLGNGVSVGAVYYVVRQAVSQYEELLKKTAPAFANAVLSSPPNPDVALRD